MGFKYIGFNIDSTCTPTARGSGKTLVVDSALKELKRRHGKAVQA